MTNSDLTGFTGDLTNKMGNYWDGCGYNRYTFFLKSIYHGDINGRLAGFI